MAKTECISLLVSQAEKFDIESRAKRVGISTSELVRWALERPDGAGDLEELAHLSNELGEAVTRMDEHLDTALARLNELDTQTANRARLATEIQQYDKA